MIYDLSASTRLRERTVLFELWCMLECLSRFGLTFPEQEKTERHKLSSEIFAARFDGKMVIGVGRASNPQAALLSEQTRAGQWCCYIRCWADRKTSIEVGTLREAKDEAPVIAQAEAIFIVGPCERTEYEREWPNVLRDLGRLPVDEKRRIWSRSRAHGHMQDFERYLRGAGFPRS